MLPRKQSCQIRNNQSFWKLIKNRARQILLIKKDLCACCLSFGVLCCVFSKQICLSPNFIQKQNSLSCWCSHEVMPHADKQLKRQTIRPTKTVLLIRCSESKTVFVVLTLVEHAWTFYMYFNAASNFYYDFLNMLRNFIALIFPCCRQLLSSCFKESSKFLRQFQAVKFCKFYYASVLILNASETTKFFRHYNAN